MGGGRGGEVPAGPTTRREMRMSTCLVFLVWKGLTVSELPLQRVFATRIPLPQDSDPSWIPFAKALGRRRRKTVPYPEVACPLSFVLEQNRLRLARECSRMASSVPVASD